MTDDFERDSSSGIPSLDHRATRPSIKVRNRTIDEIQRQLLDQKSIISENKSYDLQIEDISDIGEKSAFSNSKERNHFKNGSGFKQVIDLEIIKLL